MLAPVFKPLSAFFFSFLFWILPPLFVQASGVDAQPKHGLEDAVPSSVFLGERTDNRTIFSILWTCFATIFACTWIAVHPNIPSSRVDPRTGRLVEGEWTVLRRRFAIMAYVLIAPEMVILWAGRQHFAARKIEKMFRDQGWTRTHGFFLIMGGFALYTPPTPTSPPRFLRTLTLPTLNALLSSSPPYISLPSISAHQIADRSKSDLLSKSLVILQTTWFVVGCIGRGIERVMITELEVVTLAFAVISGFVWWLWWDKPVDVRCAVPVYISGEGWESVLEGLDLPPPKKDKKRRKKGVGGREDEQTEKDKDVVVEVEEVEADVGCEVRSDEVVRSTEAGNASEIPLMKKLDLDTPSPQFSDAFEPRLSRTERFTRYCHRQVKKRGRLEGTLLILFWAPLALFFRPLDEMLNLTTFRSTKKRDRVPTFYAPDLETEDGDSTVVMIGLMVCLVFGGIHLIAWNQPFPSDAEKWLWRVNAVLITALPWTLGFAGMLVIETDEDSTLWRKVYDKAIVLILVLGLGVYMVARVCLLVQPLMGLRILPDSAFVELTWRAYVPRIT